MTTGEDIVDGFGESVAEQVAAGSYTVTLYGGAPPPNDWEPYPYIPPVIPPTDTAPPIVPPVVFQPPKPERYQLTVTGPNGTEFVVALTAEQWAKVRAGILEALR